MIDCLVFFSLRFLSDFPANVDLEIITGDGLEIEFLEVPDGVHASHVIMDEKSMNGTGMIGVNMTN